MAILTPIKATIGIALYTLLFAGAGSKFIKADRDDKCGGIERWSVKTATDNEATDIKTKKVNRTIKEFAAINTENYVIRKKTPRQDIEFQLYTIKNCFITLAKLENDNDIHLVIEDGKGLSMVAEIPDPKCADMKSSIFFDEIEDSRKTFLEYQTMFENYMWDITGVQFIDKEHPQDPVGNLDNNIELHPVVGLKIAGKK